MKKIVKPVATPKYHHGDLRRAIMEAAVEMVGETGIEKLSMREIARKIGVTTAAPYHHFSGRPSLLIALAIEGYELLLQSLTDAIKSTVNPKGEIEAAVRAYLHFGRSRRAHYALMFSGEFYGDPRLGEMVAVADSCLEMVRKSIADTSGLGHKKSVEAAFCAWSLLHGILMLDKNGVLQETSSEQETLAVRGVLAVVEGTFGRRKKVPDKLFQVVN